MVKRIIKETVREYDDSGNILRETVTETTEDDDTMYFPTYTTTPVPNPWWTAPTCTSTKITN